MKINIVIPESTMAEMVIKALISRIARDFDMRDDDRSIRAVTTDFIKEQPELILKYLTELIEEPHKDINYTIETTGPGWVR